MVCKILYYEKCKKNNQYSRNNINHLLWTTYYYTFDKPIKLRGSLSLGLALESIHTAKILIEFRYITFVALYKTDFENTNTTHSHNTTQPSQKSISHVKTNSLSISPVNTRPTATSSIYKQIPGSPSVTVPSVIT